MGVRVGGEGVFSCTRGDFFAHAECFSRCAKITASVVFAGGHTGAMSPAQELYNPFQFQCGCRVLILLIKTKVPFFFTIKCSDECLKMFCENPSYRSLLASTFMEEGSH